MAVPTTTSWGLALGDGTFTAIQASLPLFTEGETVYRFADMPADASDAPIPATKYTVRAVQVKPFVGALDGINDQRDNDTNTAEGDGVVLSGVTGFDHEAGISGTEIASTDSRPWFYVLEDATGKFIFGIHQVAITNLAGWKTFADTKNDAIWT